VELEAESAVGSYSRPEHDVCVASVPKGGRLNPMFDLAGVLYGPRPVPCTEASKKMKMDAVGKTAAKRSKARGKKKAEPLKIVVPWAKTGAK
jgi:hypothetical protein